MTMSTPTSIGRRHEAARCEECTLNDPRNAYVGSAGPEDARLAVVGEGPGYQEGRTGIPFSGPSGKLLDAVLSEAGFERERVYLTNAVLCRPADNRTPTKMEVACCRPRLMLELDRLRPDQILCLGNTAAQSVLATSAGVTSLRVGPPKLLPGSDSVEVVATFHPAACLRQSDFYPNLKADVKKLRKDLRVNWVEPVYRVWDTEEEAVQGLRELLCSYDTFAVDIEVGIEKDTDFDHPERYQFLCIGISYATGKAVVIGEEALKFESVIRELRPLLRSQLVAHNGKFDLAALRLLEPAARLHFDTMLSSYCLDERPGVHALGYRSVEILGAPDWKDALAEYVGSGKKRRSYAFVPRDILYKYNAWDVACTWMLRDYDTKALALEGQTQLHQDYNDITMMLMNAETKGIRVDEDYFEELDQRYGDILAAREDVLSEWVKNPRSPKQVKEALDDLGLRVDSTNAMTLEVLMRKLDPDSEAGRFITAMQRYRKDHKMYSNYVKGLPLKIYNGRLHTNFLMHGTTTGRLATKEPNLLNIPRGPLIKNAFLPDEGCVFVQADYKTAELRVVAIESGDEELIAVLSDPNRDIHSEVATERYGPGFTKDQRVRAKAVVFGVGYGREAQSIAVEYDMSHKEAQGVIDALFRRYSGIPAWQDDIRKRVTVRGEDLTNHFGRKRRFHLITRDNVDNIRRECLAFIPQSTANDCNMRAAARLHLEYGYDVRLLVHDSILINCKPEDAEEVAATMAQVMQQTAAERYSTVVPFFVDTSIGKTWGELS